MSTAAAFSPDGAIDVAACVDFAENAAERLHTGDSLRLGLGDSEVRVTGDLALAIVDILRMGWQGFAVELQTLPASRVGTHRRIPTPDLLAYRERCRMERSKHIDEIIRTSQELGLYD